MLATQVLAPLVVADKIRSVLSACQYAWNADDYAQQLVRTLAIATHSEYAIWLNWPAGQGDPVAQTGGCRTVLSRLRSLCDCAPRLANDLDERFGIRSIAAAPVMFRSFTVGVLAVANGDRPYTPADLDLLREIGGSALAEYESRERAEALGLPSMPDRMADFIHELRQPLGVLEACACFLELVLPEGEVRAREQLEEMHSQLDVASRILGERARAYAPRCSRPEFDTDAQELEEETAGVFADSVMSLVT